MRLIQIIFIFLCYSTLAAQADRQVSIYFGPNSTGSTEYSQQQLRRIAAAYQQNAITITQIDVFYLTKEETNAVQLSEQRLDIIETIIGVSVDSTNIELIKKQLGEDEKIQLPNVRIHYHKKSEQEGANELTTVETTTTQSSTVEKQIRFEDIDTTFESFGFSGDSTAYGVKFTEIPEMESNRDKEYRLSDGAPMRPNDLFKKKSTAEKLEEAYRKKKDYILNIQFKRGSESNMTADSKQALDELAEFLINNPEVTILIRGHVCCVNRKKSSKKRAAAVRDKLVKMGVDKSRMKIKGMSNKEPIAWPEDTEADRQANRRVDIQFTN